jgi:hypothetical protein
VTIVNFAVERTRALIAADSLTSTSSGVARADHDGAPLVNEKLRVLHRSMCVLSLTGSLHLRHHLEEAAQHLTRFDQCVEAFPTILRSAPAYLHRHYIGTRYSAGSTAYLVGWSDHRGRMAGADFSSGKLCATWDCRRTSCGSFRPSKRCE